MGYEVLYRPNSNGFIELSETELCDVDDLQYHNDWNWLMPVVEKIEFEHDCLVIINSPLQVIITNKDIGQRETPLLDEVFEIEVSDRGTKRDCLYKAIVEFINEYNRTDDHRNI